MKQFRKIWPKSILAVGLFLSCFSVNAQNSLIGRDFIFSVLGAKPAPGEKSITFVTIAAAYPDTQKGKVYLDIPATGASQVFEFNGRLTQAPVGWGYEVDEKTFADIEEGKDGFSIHIHSEIDVTVLLTKHFEGENYNHGDATMVLPIRELGTQYYVMSHNEIDSEYNSELVVVATEDNTYVDIIPSADTRAHAAGFPLTIKLNKGERYQLQSRFDLTGTYVGLNTDLDQSCKPFAVFSGSSRSTVGELTDAGHMFAQMYPTDKWANQFSLVPFELKQNEYLIKVLAYENNTKVELKTEGVESNFTLQSGEFKELNFAEAVRINANRKILVAQYFKGFTVDKQKADPFMILPIGHQNFSHQLSNNWAPNMSFSRLVQRSNPPLPNPPFHSVVLNLSDTAQFDHQTKAYKENMVYFKPDSSFVYSNFYPSRKFDGFSLKGESGHALYLYTLGKEKFTVNLGIEANILFVDSDTLTFEISPIVSQTVDYACLTESLLFHPVYTGQDSNNPPLSFFEWDFGDGSKKVGEDVNYQYAEAGTYVVSLRTLGEKGGCIKEEIVNKQITVVDTRIKKFDGATEVCPFAQNAIYSVEGHDDNTYTWEVVGGRLVSNSGNRVVINWDGPNTNAYVKVISSNPYACQPEEKVLNVNLNPNSLPGMPHGKSVICTNDNIQEYSVPFTFANSSYNWQVTNGTILEGQGTEKIKVEWTGTSSGSVYYTKTSTGQSAGCDGQAPALDVKIVEAANVQVEVQHITCEGSTDGQIKLVLPQGSGPYKVTWENGSLGAIRSGLDVGQYEAVVTDGNNCVTTITQEITKQDVLNVQLDLKDGSCFGAGDASARLNISGGVEPYQVFWNGGVTAGLSTRNGLSAGNYSVRIMDARGCEINRNFDLKEPEVFEASISVTETCAGERTGRITVFPTGGQAPYEYSWNNEGFVSQFQEAGLGAGFYDVIVRDASGCQVRLSQVEVPEVQQSLKLPNAFSPNNDGVNDTFEAIFDCSVSSFLMQVYSKWGEVIYSSNSISASWDGTLNGNPLYGSFYYVVRYTSPIKGVETERILRGNVLVIR